MRLRLHAEAGGGRICSGCGCVIEKVHDSLWREVRDLPTLDCRTYIIFQRRRLECSRCGAKLERLSGLKPYARVTNRLASERGTVVFGVAGQARVAAL